MQGELARAAAAEGRAGTSAAGAALDQRRPVADRAQCACSRLAKGPLSVGRACSTPAQKRDPQPFMGDLFFWSVVRDLIEAPQPAARGQSSATRRLGWQKRVAAPHADRQGAACRQARLAIDSPPTLGRRHRCRAAASLALESRTAWSVRTGSISATSSLTATVGTTRRAEGIGRDGPASCEGCVTMAWFILLDRRSLRDRLGDRPQIHRRLHASCAVGAHRRRDDRQRRPARHRAEDAAGRHRLCRLDRHRRRRHGDPRHLSCSANRPTCRASPRSA